MKAMKVAKVNILVFVLWMMSFVSWSDPWYCKECDKIHDFPIFVCPKPLFGRTCCDLINHMNLLEEIQSGAESLSASARVIFILRLIYCHTPRALSFKEERRVVDIERLQAFSNALWEDIYEKEKNFDEQKCESSDLVKINGEFHLLRGYLEDESHYEGFNTDGFENKVKSYVKNVAQKCSLSDLRRVQTVLERYEGSKYDTEAIIQTVKIALNLPNLTDTIGMGHYSPISFLKIVQKTFSDQCKTVELLYEAEKILQGPPLDKSYFNEIIELMSSCGEFEAKIEKMQNDIETLLNETKTLSITNIIEKLMERYAFSFGAIVPCHFLCYWLRMGYYQEVAWVHKR